jgi:hypothetical protein
MIVIVEFQEEFVQVLRWEVAVLHFSIKCNKLRGFG